MQDQKQGNRNKRKQLSEQTTGAKTRRPQAKMWKKHR